ncbi:SGNH/GDSL hydrolase family protein [Dyella japonica]|uniref:SGNH/GDSL hydrolase family protein n=1 Tax=Dyella japonica TaxID=231455 RepID=UPI00030867D3|nr:SGNH/GDSL hydrolase family protein [Dyella japonica]
MKRLTWLALLLMSLVAPAMAQADSQPSSHWIPDIEAFVAADREHPPMYHSVLFIGSSSIQFWKSLAEDFPGIPVINRGFGGSALPDSTYYADRIVWPYKPAVIVMYAGDNDVNDGATAGQVLASFQQFVARARQGVPGVPIVYISIKPSVERVALWPAMKAANDRIRDWAATQKDVRFVDIAPVMLDAQGKPRAELFRPDGLHMLPAGYALWIAALKPVLADYGFVIRSGT